MDDTTRSCREFADLLASAEPAPGGGGAAALAGALGTALGRMVGALSVEKKRYADVREELLAQMEQCRQLQEALLDQVEADRAGFLPLAAAYGIPKDDPDRAQTLERASVGACEAPMRILELCAQSLASVAVFAEKGSRLAVSDAGCAAALIRGAMQAAALNVFINTKSLSDRACADALNSRCLALVTQGEQQADALYRSVRESLLPTKREAE